MHIVTLLGDSQAGKTALCSQWSGCPPCTSYVTTFSLEYHLFPELTVIDTPSCPRFPFELEILTRKTQLFVLVMSKDQCSSEWYDRVDAVDLPWLIILNGSGSFRRSRRWALSQDIRVFQVDLATGSGVSEAMDCLRMMLESLDPIQASVDLTMDHYLRTVPFLGVLYSSCV